MNIRHGMQLLAFILPLVAAYMLSTLATRLAAVPTLPVPLRLVPVYVQSLEELESLFEKVGYDWPLETGPVVPRMMLTSLPAGLTDDLSVERKKALFLRILLPVVLAENRHIRQQRAWLKQVLAEGVPSEHSSAWRQLLQLAKEYDVSGNLHEVSKQRRLLQRIDEVPVALVLAQAANESGWGSSRFVQQANNLFGHWTYNSDQGILPLKRDKGKSHRVRVFPTLRLSVRAYLHNLNTSHAYSQLRQLRSAMRDKGQALNGDNLAAGLINYSERGEDYVREIRALIQGNTLDRYESVQLRDGPRLPPAASDGQRKE